MTAALRERNGGAAATRRAILAAAEALLARGGEAGLSIRALCAIAAAGRLVPPVEDATAAFWSAVHGVTSLLIAGFWKPGAPAATLVRDAMLDQLTAQLTRKEAAPCRPTRLQTPSCRETSRPGPRKARPGTSPSSGRFPAS